MHAFTQSLRLLLAPVFALLLCASTHATPKTYLVNFGGPDQQPYVFHQGDFGLTTAPVIINDSATGDYAGFGYKNLSYKIGPAKLTFPVVGGYNLDQTASSAAALIGTFIFSNPDRKEVGSPVTFTLTTASPADKITIAAISSVQDAQQAVVTIGTAVKLVDSNQKFVTIVTNLTGKTTYTGSFATDSGDGEADIAGFLITIDSAY